MAHDLTYHVNLDSPIAVYVQIENQVQFGIAAGKLKSGDTLPSVREMSTALNVNPNTVTKAYRDLELMQLVHTRRGVGVTISEKASKVCKETILVTAMDHLQEGVAECLACGIPASEIRKIVSQTVDSGAMPYANGKAKHK